MENRALNEWLMQCQKARSACDKVKVGLLVRKAIKFLPSFADDNDRIVCMDVLCSLWEFLGEEEEIQKGIDSILQTELPAGFKFSLWERKAFTYMRIGQREQGVLLFQQMLEFAKKEGDEEMLVHAFKNLAKYYNQEKDYDQSMKYWNDMLEKTKKLHHLPLQIYALSSMAAILYKKRHYNLALEYLREAEELGIEAHDTSLLYQVALKRCKIYSELGMKKELDEILNALFELE